MNQHEHIMMIDRVKEDLYAEDSWPAAHVIVSLPLVLILLSAHNIINHISLTSS